MPSDTLITDALDVSALRVEGLASLLARDRRTVERWLAGDPIPDTARRWLARYLTLTDDQRAHIALWLAER